MVKFLRRTSDRYSKLGKGRKKKQIWRRPTGRDNKMREKRRGYPAIVSIGHKKESSKEKKLVIVRNLNDLKKIKEKEMILIGKIGMKNKLEILKKAKEMKIVVYETNIDKFLKKNRKIEKIVEIKKQPKEKKK
ncbi:MAG: eL32 family ribosomal protein [Nanoarchaeota archaeon]|nr:eL32 family ribosomal protein [Nanoarchaeota archaeon]